MIEQIAWRPDEQTRERAQLTRFLSQCGLDSFDEAAVIGIPDEVKGNSMIAFCVISEEAKGDDSLAEELRRRVGAELGKPLRPERVFFVPAIPKTRNAKVMRRVIRAAYLNEDPGDVTALENLATVEMIQNLRQTT